MSKNNLERKMWLTLASKSSMDFEIARQVAFLTSVICAFYTCYQIAYIDGWLAMYTLSEHHYASHGRWLHEINALRVAITVAFVIGTYGLWLRTAKGFLISIVSMIIVIGFYIWWYYGSMEYLEGLNLPHVNTNDFQHFGGLREGSWWDMIALVTAISLLFWEAKASYKSWTFSSRKSN